MSQVQKSKKFNAFNFLKEIDHFGVNLNFQYKQKKIFKSSFGGCVFICYIFFCFSYLLTNYRNFVDRTRMNLIYNEGVERKAPPINFSNYSIGVAIGILPDNFKDLDEIYKYLGVSFEIRSTEQVNGTSIRTRRRINLDKCTESSFYNAVNESFQDLKLSNYFCPNLTDSEMAGIYSEPVFKFYEFSVFLKPEAVNETAKVKKIFNSNELKAHLLYLDYAITVDDYNNPINRYISQYFAVLDFGFFKKINFDFMPIKFISDANILFNGEKEENYVVLGGFQEYFVFKGEDRNEVKPKDWTFYSKIYLRSSPRTKYIKRIYQKATEYLANVSSLLSSALVFLMIIVSTINFKKAQQSIIRQIIKYKEDHKFHNNRTIKYLKDKFKDDCKLFFINFIF